MPLPLVGTHVLPSSSEKDVLQVGESSVSSPAKTRPVWRSVKPIGSESMNCEVGAGRLTQLAVVPLAPSLNVTKRVSRSDWKLTTPVFQFAPIEGSPAPRPMYSTVAAPELV